MIAAQVKIIVALFYILAVFQQECKRHVKFNNNKNNAILTDELSGAV